ncbi:MAG: helix-turn-helix transcriptional regulator [Coriobacteriaceae bacterium]|nr:helix-turn-helix transcriptional regulator [Coriobacteriaceae bacterium]
MTAQDERIERGGESSERLNVLHIGGMALYFAFVLLLCVSGEFGKMTDSFDLLIRFLLLGIVVATMLALLCFSYLKGTTMAYSRVGLDRWALVSGSILSIGLWCPSFIDSAGGLAVAAAFVALGSVLLMLVWAYSIMASSLRVRVLSSALATIGGTALYLGIILLPSGVSFALAASVPLLSGVAAHRYWRRAKKRQPVAASVRLKGIIDVRLLAFTAVFGCLFSLIGHALLKLSGNPGPDIMPGAIGAAAFLVVQVMLALSMRTKISPRVAYRTAPLLVAGGFFLLPFADRGILALDMALAFSGFGSYVVYYWIVLGNIASRYRIVPEIVFTLGLAMLPVGALVGELMILGLDGMALEGSMYSTSIALTSLSLLILAFWQASDGAVFASETKEMGGQYVVASDTLITDAISRTDAMANAFKLSPREHDILHRIMMGRDVPAICEELVLSKNTVQTHVKHIYQKTGVSKRQHLIALADELVRKNT